MEYLKQHGIWNDQWHKALVEKLCDDVKNGERTFEVDKNTGELISRLKVVSGGLEYTAATGEKGIIRAKKRITYQDKDGNSIPDRTKEFYEKDDRIVGGKIRGEDSPEATFSREAREELPDELYGSFDAGHVTIGDAATTESISPGYPNLKTVFEVHPARTSLDLYDGFDTRRGYMRTEEKHLPNGEMKITEIKYELVPATEAKSNARNNTKES